MEPVVYDETPLAEYLKDGGDESDADWAPVANTPDVDSSSQLSQPSPPASPTPLAPTGRPKVKSQYRKNIPSGLKLDLSKPYTLTSIRRNYSAAVAASIDRADNAKFLEQFRYTIVASQLLSGYSVPGRLNANIPSAPVAIQDRSLLSIEGILASVFGALVVAIILSWILSSGPSQITKKRLAFLILLLAASAFLGPVYMRRRWLRYQRDQSLTEIASFVTYSHEYDSATGAALALVQEVELVSRGYRLSAPLPPISRLEDRSQGRKCVRLRKALRSCFATTMQAYTETSKTVKGFSEQTELEKYCDIYDISEFDISDAYRGFDEEEFEDLESLRTLKIVAARYHTIRKLFLCSLLALEADGDSLDLLRWTTTVEALQKLNQCTRKAYQRLQEILSEEESFPVPVTPTKGPLSPGSERWRSQLRKLNSLSTGIRGLQAKLQLLREESDRALNDSSDISELAPNLMSQYDSIGVDLKELATVWEEGRAALAQGIDRNEKRLSSMSTLISPSTSLSGLTTVDEGTSADALKALTGESSVGSESNEPAEVEAPEVFEAVAKPRPRSMLTREERLMKMREDREHKAQARQQVDATRGMLRELETVINLRPRNRASAPGGRVVSM